MRPKQTIRVMLKHLFFSALFFTRVLGIDSSQFDCPFRCGRAGSTSMREVEWSFTLCLWQLERLSHALEGKSTPKKPPSHEDFWVDRNGEPTVVKSKGMSCCPRPWEREPCPLHTVCVCQPCEVRYTLHHFGDKLRFDFEFFDSREMKKWDECERCGTPFAHPIDSVKPRYWEVHFDSLRGVTEGLDTIDWIAKKLFYDNTHMSYTSVCKLLKSDREKSAEKDEFRRALDAEYHKQLSIYSQFIPWIQFQKRKIKESYADILDHCIEAHGAPKSHYEKSQLAFLDGYYSDCLEILRQLFDLFPAELLSEQTNYDLILQRGAIESQLALYDDAIATLSDYINAYPLYKAAYLERALVYLEKGDFERSITDYLTSKRPYSHIRTVSDAHMIEFSTGLISGISMHGFKVIWNFMPSTLTSLGGVGRGLWALACEPADVSVDICDACREMIVFLKKYSPIETLIPEIKELKTLDSHSHREEGEVIGKIIGKYGIDYLLFAGMGEGIKPFVNLDRANKILTLETMAKGHVKKEVLASISLEMAKTNKIVIDPLIKGNVKHLDKNLHKAFKKQSLSEFHVRKILHHAGFRTYPRPQGIPNDAIVNISRSGGGMKYIKAGATPKERIHVRVMPGNPSSPHPWERSPHVVQRRGKYAVAKNGALVEKDTPEACIPLEDFKFRVW